MIGGGDTGADCVGNALREGARSIVQLELLAGAARPAPRRADPVAPVAAEVPPQLRHGGGRARWTWASRTTRMATDAVPRRRSSGTLAGTAHRAGRSRAAVRADPGQRARAARAAGAAGDGLPRSRAGAARPARRRARRARQRRLPSSPYTTSVDGVFAAGDARRGQSLIVWAINEGRQCARMVDRYLAEPRRRGPARGRAPEDDGLAGHADADEGPEGPPQHVGPGRRQLRRLSARRRRRTDARERVYPSGDADLLPPQPLHRALPDLQQDAARQPSPPKLARAAARRLRARPPRGGERCGAAADRAREGLRVRREGRAADDGYRSALVPGLRASRRRRAAGRGESPSPAARCWRSRPTHLASTARLATLGAADLEQATWIVLFDGLPVPTRGRGPVRGHPGRARRLSRAA